MVVEKIIGGKTFIIDGSSIIEDGFSEKLAVNYIDKYVKEVLENINIDNFIGDKIRIVL